MDARASRPSGGRRTPAQRPSRRLTMSSVRILISAGEASGEMYGAQLIAACGVLRASRRDHIEPKLEFFGVGGDRMRAAGCDTVVDANDLAVVGITEILSHLPKICGLFQPADRRSRPAQARSRHRHRLSRLQLARRTPDEQARHSCGLLRLLRNSGPGGRDGCGCCGSTSTRRW